MTASPDGRVDAWIYGETEEPDVRFILANERTFLAWIRTSLAFLAVAVGVDALHVGSVRVLAVAAPLLLSVLSAGCAVYSWWSWARSERAIRRREPLPTRRAPLPLVAGIVLAVVGVAVALLS